MSPRLLSIELLPKPGGLALPQHAFGEFLTLIHGENGSGKTVLMCALYWALGGTRQVAEPVWSRCTGVRLALRASDGRNATIERAFSTGLDASIQVGDEVRTYDLEGGFSAAILALLGIPRRDWTAKSGGTCPVYTSVLVPAFAIDQDKGWSMPYAAFDAKDFIRDQAEEVARLLFGLSPKHDVERDRMRERMERQVARLAREIDVRTRTIDSLAKSALKSETGGIDQLRNARERLQQELRSFDGVVTAFAEANEGMRTRVNAARAEFDEIEMRLSNARRRRAALDRLTEEVKGDLEVVGSNEVAAQAFRRFCGNSSCQFFQGKDVATSYGKRVLYLRDQLKDVAAAMDSSNSEIAALRDRREASAVALAQVRSEYEGLAKASGAQKVSTLVDTVARELARVSNGIAIAEQIQAERLARDQLSADRDRIETDIRNHDAARKERDARDAEMRRSFDKIFDRWLTLLGTNDHGKVTIDSSFRVTIDGVPLRDTNGPSGSSRTRFMLAFHAARLETSLGGGGAHPGLLLLDAPKQHELKTEDFEAYMRELRKLGAQHPDRIQLVISLSSGLPLAKNEVQWDPPFPGERHSWFLGPVTAVK
ncbi:MAG: AAA family ATPase [Sandaracinaceae bacterium]|nr:AAA family ATPase [Sandaracinaceae bacterium]